MVREELLASNQLFDVLADWNSILKGLEDPYQDFEP